MELFKGKEQTQPPALAYPLFAVTPPGLDGNSGVIIQFGMTLRDHFAAQALPALIEVGHLPVVCAEWAYSYADEMMKRRKEVSHA